LAYFSKETFLNDQGKKMGYTYSGLWKGGLGVCDDKNLT